MHEMNQEEGGHVTSKETHSLAGTGASGSSGFNAGVGASTSGGSESTGWNSGTSGDPGTCPQCGQSGGGLDQFLGRLGITTEMLDSLKGQFENIDIDDYLNTACQYLKDGSGKATTYAKDNPGKIAAGIAVLALGAGLIWSTCQTTQDVEDRSRQLELKRALGGRKYRLDEVLRELDVAV